MMGILSESGSRSKPGDERRKSGSCEAAGANAGNAPEVNIVSEAESTSGPLRLRCNGNVPEAAEFIGAREFAAAEGASDELVFA